MQLLLSNLVDLALGNSKSVGCENFDVLHTLLHVMLKKLNLADSRIELSKEMTENIDVLLKNLPKEPIICFKDYHLKPDGGKIRKKSFSACPKKSLTHVTKKCTAQHDLKNFSLQDLTEKFNCTAKVLNSRISQIEAKMARTNEPKNCDLKVNIRSNSEDTENDSDVGEENESLEDMDMASIDWLEEKILELSDSLKLHSNCLKRLKCEELPKIQQNFIENFEALENAGTERKEISNVITEVRNSFEAQISYVSDQIQNLKGAFCEYEKKMDEEISSLKLMNTQQNCKTNVVNSNEESSHPKIKTAEILEKKSRSSVELNSNDDNQLKENLFEGFFSSSNIFKSQKSFTESTESPSLSEIKKQLASQSVCMNQIVRNLASKVDNCEFEIYCRKLNDVSDAFMQFKKDTENLPTAAGCTIPLMKNVNCISCQGNANMTVASTTIPKLPSLKFGRVSSECPHNCCRADHKMCNEAIKFQRKTGGSHTKISRRSNIAKMRYRRLGTPYKCSTPLTIFRSRYHKSSHQM